METRSIPASTNKSCVKPFIHKANANRPAVRTITIADQGPEDLWLAISNHFLYKIAAPVSRVSDQDDITACI
jgi:hypothetical protein